MSNWRIKIFLYVYSFRFYSNQMLWFINNKSEMHHFKVDIYPPAKHQMSRLNILRAVAWSKFCHIFTVSITIATKFWCSSKTGTYIIAWDYQTQVKCIIAFLPFYPPAKFQMSSLYTLLKFINYRDIQLVILSLTTKLWGLLHNISDVLYLLVATCEVSTVVQQLSSMNTLSQSRFLYGRIIGRKDGRKAKVPSGETGRGLMKTVLPRLDDLLW